MANNMTDQLELKLLDLANGVTTAAPVTGPMKLALLTTLGSDSSAGVEVSGGSYARQTITFAAASGGASSNTNAITFNGMPACTVVGMAIYDSAGTPLRCWTMPVTEQKTYAAGDVATVGVGTVTVGLD